MKKELKISTGDWELNQEKEYWCEVFTKEPKQSICAVNVHLYEHIANGKLIACAPEMFSLLSELENDDNSIPKWLWDKIQNVLIKAST